MTRYVKGGSGGTAEVGTRVKVAWYKRRELTPVICDKQMSLRLRAKVDKSMMRLVLLYGAETWATKETVASNC